jgi:hypothetical protein
MGTELNLGLKPRTWDILGALADRVTSIMAVSMLVETLVVVTGVLPVVRQTVTLVALRTTRILPERILVILRIIVLSIL